mmetsp:Transcript_45848/g.113991  ORF Transcript_45848/g.113991 Transcript_45848/m.113991 type:complete len:201 (-) Transcript_45848:830-1432(-)
MHTYESLSVSLRSTRSHLIERCATKPPTHLILIVSSRQHHPSPPRKHHQGTHLRAPRCNLPHPTTAESLPGAPARTLPGAPAPGALARPVPAAARCSRPSRCVRSPGMPRDLLRADRHSCLHPTAHPLASCRRRLRRQMGHPGRASRPRHSHRPTPPQEHPRVNLTLQRPPGLWRPAHGPELSPPHRIGLVHRHAPHTLH